MPAAPGRRDGGKSIGGGCGCAGATSAGGGAAPRGTLPGGRGGGSLKIEPNCASAGAAVQAIAAETIAILKTLRVMPIRRPRKPARGRSG
jgi:hypothetical protein